MRKTNKEDLYRMIGASNHSAEDREENDYYSTDEDCVRDLLRVESFSHTILEPCCGEGAISKTLEEAGYEVISSDLIDRGYGKTGVDMFSYHDVDYDAITNQPYGLASDAASHFLKEAKPGRKIALFLKI